MKIYFLRHGQTEWNVKKKLQGRTDTPLNENGRASAVECGKKLAGISFDYCITSPLKRAVDTADLILAENRQTKPVHTIDERLIEYCFGEWEGRIFKGPGYELPVKEYGDYWDSLSDEMIYPGMEGRVALTARVRSFLDEMTERFSDQDVNILVVAHGAVLRAVHVLLDDSQNTFKIVPVENCAVFILEPDPNAAEEQKTAGIKPGDLKYGRRLKMTKACL